MKPLYPTLIKIKRNMYTREIFFGEYGESFGSINHQKTVETINAILGRAEKENTQLEQLAYMLATSLHEAQDKYSDSDFYPLTERGGYKYITDQYWYNKKVRGWLGNRTIEEAWNLRGRGLVQITGFLNYNRFGILHNPDKALEMDKAVEILFMGMQQGLFTSRPLKRYISCDGVNYEDARQTVNGMDDAEHISDLAKKFESILKLSKL